MRDFFRGKFFITLVFIAAFLAGFMLNMLLDGGVTAHRDIIGVIVTPFNTFGTWVKNGVGDFFGTFSEYDSLKAENEQLKKRVTELEKQVIERYSYDVELDRLRGLAGVTETAPELAFIAADVVSLSSDGFGSSFSINKGTADGIELKAVAVSAEGLVGKITAVGLNWATVTAITDPSVSVGATAPRSGDTGVTEGTAALRAKGFLRLSYLPADASVIRGDSVYTSGLGGVYPEGILIGTIDDVVAQDNGLTQYAVISPAAVLGELRRIYVTNGAWSGQ